MSYTKTPESETDPVRQMMILQSRRMDDVKKNFAIGSRRIIATGSTNKEPRFRTKADSAG